MRTRIQKWGNSLALRIPKSFADEVGLEQDTSVEVSLKNGKLIVAPVVESAPTLAQLMAQVNERNLHREVNTGPTMGNEVW